MRHFRIAGPGVISFSGGRTSAYMLRRCLDVGIDADVHVLFADTGKERVETYEFVAEVARRWGVLVHTVRRDPEGHATPFDRLIAERKFLPNPVTRFCTQELKIRPMRDWMRARGYEHWTNAVGIRADEPRRVAKMRAAAEKRSERWDIALPLADAGVTVEEVEAFWRCQPFDLRLRRWEGNCDLCFLKGTAKRERIMRDRPDLADWWIAKEAETGALFRADALPYAALMRRASLPMLPFAPEDLDGIDDMGDCVCEAA